MESFHKIHAAQDLEVQCHIGQALEPLGGGVETSLWKAMGQCDVGQNFENTKGGSRTCG